MSPACLPPPGAGAPHLKVCGLRRPEDAALAAELGARFLGVVLTRKSRRTAGAAEARAIAEAARTHPARPWVVGVFTDESPAEVAALAEAALLDAVQLHRGAGEVFHLAVPVVPAVPMRGPEDAAAAAALLAAGHPAVLLDAHKAGEHGGTGERFPHGWAAAALAAGPVFIAGGLAPENIAAVVADFRARGSRPYAFDFSSGVESAPGVKDAARLRLFFERYFRAWEG